PATSGRAWAGPQPAVAVDRAGFEVIALEHELHAEPEVFGLADPSDGDGRHEGLARLLVHAAGHRRLDHARSDAAASNAERRPLERPRPRDGGEARLRGAVVALPPEPVARDARDVDHDAAGRASGL